MHLTALNFALVYANNQESNSLCAKKANLQKGTSNFGLDLGYTCLKKEQIIPFKVRATNGITHVLQQLCADIPFRHDIILSFLGYFLR